MKLSNKEKDYMKIIGFLAIVIWILSGAIYYLFAQEIKLTDIENANKFYAEEQIKTEIRYLAMRDYIENMSEEEYIETFFAGEVQR